MSIICHADCIHYEVPGQDFMCDETPWLAGKIAQEYPDGLCTRYCKKLPVLTYMDLIGKGLCQ
jgi:hypothetical protein